MTPRRQVNLRIVGPPPASKAPDGAPERRPFEGGVVELVNALRAGDQAAAARLYDEYVDFVHRLLFRTLGPDTELDDVVQDVFMRALKSITNLRDPQALRSWMHGLTVQTAMIWLQTRIRRRRWLMYMPRDKVPEPVILPPDGSSAAALREVWVLFDRLTPEERVAFVLRRVDGLSFGDAAAATGLSLSTFKRRLARAEARFFASAKQRPALAQWLEGFGEGGNS